MAATVGALEHLDVYENPSRFVVVGRRRVDGGTASALGYQLLVVDRELPPGEEAEVLPPVSEEQGVLTPAQCERRLAELGDGAPLIKVLGADALLGMIRFLEGWHMLFVTRREPVGVLCGHCIYRVEETAMVNVCRAGAGGCGTSAGGGAQAAASSCSANARRPPKGTALGGLLSAAWASAGEFATRIGHGRWGDGWAEDRYKVWTRRPRVEAAASPPRRVRVVGCVCARARRAQDRHVPRRACSQDLFRSMELSRDFYFSYTYDLTNTLQVNMKVDTSAGGTCVRAAEEGGVGESPAAGGGRDGARCNASASPQDGPSSLRHRFVWNHHLLGRLLRRVGDRCWVVPLIHGFFQQVSWLRRAPACHLPPPQLPPVARTSMPSAIAQASLSFFGRVVTLTLLARRSRVYAGARLLKRGLSEHGDVANEASAAWGPFGWGIGSHHADRRTNGDRGHRARPDRLRQSRLLPMVCTARCTKAACARPCNCVAPSPSCGGTGNRSR